MKGLVRLFVALVSCCVFASTSLYAQSAVASEHSSSDSGKFGAGVKVSLLGVGAEVAARVNHKSNVRAGFNVLGYSRNFSKDGVNYDGHLTFRTIEAHYDFFPWAKSFHISGGILDYLGNPITANALVPGNQSFTFNHTTYYSDPADPARASGRVNFNQVSPTLTVGWGNLIHRDSKRFSIPFEVGVAFQGSPKSTLGLTGSVCDTAGVGGNPGTNCRTVASDPTVQTNVVAEQTKIDNSVKPFKFYPIISVGFGYKF